MPLFELRVDLRSAQMAHIPDDPKSTDHLNVVVD